MDKLHLIKRDEIDDFFQLPSIALCGLVFHPGRVVSDVKCEKCDDRLNMIERISNG